MHVVIDSFINYINVPFKCLIQFWYSERCFGLYLTALLPMQPLYSWIEHTVLLLRPFKIYSSAVTFIMALEIYSQHEWMGFGNRSPENQNETTCSPDFWLCDIMQ